MEKAGSKKRKGTFYLKREDAERFEYSESCYISDIRDRLNRICSAGDVKKITITGIWDYLAETGLVMEEEREGRFFKVPTEEGCRLGIRTEDRISQRGMAYQVLTYPEAVQRMAAAHFAELGEKSEEEREQTANQHARSNVGRVWSQEEDDRLIREFHSGMKMSEIAAAHKRTGWAVQARLVKHGLME